MNPMSRPVIVKKVIIESKDKTKNPVIKIMQGKEVVKAYNPPDPPYSC